MTGANRRCGTIGVVIADTTAPGSTVDGARCGARDEALYGPLFQAVELARQAAQAELGDTPVGEHVQAQAEDGGAVTHLFEANLPGYRGWRWAVTVASAGPATPVTVSEVVLLPGRHALVAPPWLPWTQRLRAGDLGVGDLLPTDPDDQRLVPGYLIDDDPAAAPLSPELGLGRRRVLSRDARLALVQRWRDSDRGPDSEMARSAPDRCVTCGFYLPLGGILAAALGACGNDLSPADGQVVHAEFGCGAHSEVRVDTSPNVAVVELVYDDAELELLPRAPGE